MDSGNSSSMQSSSGGGDQEEYESRADQSISALFNNNNSTTVSSNIAGQTQLDSLIANYFNTGWSTYNPLLAATTTKPTDGSTPPPPLPPPISAEQAFFTNPLQQNLRAVSNTNTTSPICSVPTDKKNGLATARNLKKRSRVSRRAPTTVLTTDTSNFRAMVQEFTGSPSTPFTGSLSSSFPRSRFDLFSPSSSSRPLKPFPHKLIPPSSTSHQYLNPPSTNYHQSLLRNTNTQNIANHFLINQSPSNVPLMDQSLSLRTSNGVGHVDVGTNFEGLHSIIASSSSSMTQPTLNTMHGLDMVPAQRSDGYTTPVASGTENNLGVVRNEGTVDLSWISSSSD
ncbi:VQ motif-containing protein [Raphanus sativus]|nr:VQ motif-containing protein [Raphanus sativus]